MRKWSKLRRAKFEKTITARRARKNPKLIELSKKVNEDFVRDSLFNPNLPKPLPTEIFIMGSDGTLKRFVRHTTSIYVPEEFSL